jgi:Tfp pilus assembly protein PilN
LRPTTLNLATRPFRNERLPTLLVALAAAALVLVTVRHAFLLKDLLPGRVSELDREALGLEQELQRLREESSRLRGPRPEPERVKQWTALRGLVDQRAFSWTTLLASLEDVLPDGVRLVSIAPMLKDGRVTLDITAVARQFEDRHLMLRALDESPEFEDVFLRTAGETEGGEEFTYSTRYLPGEASGPRADPVPDPAVESTIDPAETKGETPGSPTADASGNRS